MSQEASPITGKIYGLKRVCEMLGVARSSIYNHKQALDTSRKKPGPLGIIPDPELLRLIKEDIKASPFKGEGHKKVHVRIRRQGTPVAKGRVLRLMRENQLLSPHRGIYRAENPHDGKIITSAPNEMWCSDGTKVLTAQDGWVWIFLVEEHWNAECLGWNVCKVGDRFAAFEPISQAVKAIYGIADKDVAKGLKLRIDNGCQYTSDYFLNQLKHLGIEDSFGLLRQPETNGVAERFNRTLKEQIIHGHVYQNIEELREAVRQFVEVYNEKWLIGKLGYRSPREARRKYKTSGATAA
jgi:putative transposase